MNRITVALLAALDALIAVAIGIGIALVPLTVLWAVQFGATDWSVFWHASADIWLLGHGVDLTITLPAALATSLGLSGASASFSGTIALLGFSMLAVLLGARTGRRAAIEGSPVLGGVTAVIVYGALGAAITLTADNGAVSASDWQGMLLPPFVFALGVVAGLVGSAFSDTRRRVAAQPGTVASERVAPFPADAPAGRIRAWYSGLTPANQDALAASLRGGGAAAALLLAAASVVTGLMIVTHFGAVIGLYEGLHAGVLGGVVLTLAQLALLPNLVIFTATWLAGPGFAIGTGSAVGPLGTQLGPVPGLPVFGALPQGELLFGFLGVIVPVLAGFAAGGLVARRLAPVPGSRRGLGWALLTACGGGVVAGAAFALLAWWSGGAAGPGRLASVGPNPWLVGACVAVEVAVGMAIGLQGRRSGASRSASA